MPRRRHRLRGVLVTDASDDGAAASFVEREIAEKIFEAASDAGGSGVGLLVCVAQVTGRGGDDVLTGLHVDARVEPGGIAGELNFLREAEFSGRSGGGS